MTCGCGTNEDIKAVVFTELVRELKSGQCVPFTYKKAALKVIVAANILGIVNGLTPQECVEVQTAFQDEMKPDVDIDEFSQQVIDVVTADVQ